ncbi:ABC transport system, permease component YbhS [Marinobacterium lacunae]|uniref:Transport permease protein n=1 Tax=Marinobacterium lacunae TaxID=1232683 RepID=A0A081G1M0_9GAMM|nr:ABC transporter permease [Marinobacterium lacunae]KEA64675.1 ABC transport system, permease component YbhS [Marinobacterium lacunae]MBR9885486.1 ABC transporter permease [Oceanospirillales bacterium]
MSSARQGGFWLRLFSLIRKETRQLLRDKSNLMIGIGLPIVLILIFGYGVSLDVRNIRLALVLDDHSPVGQDFVSGLTLSRYFEPLSADSMVDAEQMMKVGTVEGILHLSSDFARQLSAGHAQVQLIVSGTEAPRAGPIVNYLNTQVALWQQKRADRAGIDPSSGARVELVERIWFNDANTSTWFLVPGLIVLIMTLVGTFLTALVMAREWERGTLEALFVTPVRPTEVLLAKVTPYFGVGMLGLALCMIAGRVLFDVPINGSLPVLLFASMLYLLVALGIGLLISSATKNQFLASQIAILASFLPALMLSGFVFDLRNLPIGIQVISYALPATYFIELIRTLFLAGNFWPLIIKDCLILGAYAVVLLSLARVVTRKRLD